MTTNVQTDEGILRLDFDPKAHKTPESAARALYEALKPHVVARGQNPETELSLLSPDQTAETGYGKSWWVIWEAGPWEWSIPASFALHGDGWWTEPYWGFDLQFFED
jgi:hypothetical protein